MKAKLNYLVDALIALAFLLSAGTGVLFLFLGSGGYQGGANAAFGSTFLGLSRWVWSDLHTWASLIMISGVLLHVVLHWKWIVCVTRQVFARPQPRIAREESCPA